MNENKYRKPLPLFAEIAKRWNELDEQEGTKRIREVGRELQKNKMKEFFSRHNLPIIKIIKKESAT